MKARERINGKRFFRCALLLCLVATAVLGCAGGALLAARSWQAGVSRPAGEPPALEATSRNGGGKAVLIIVDRIGIKELLEADTPVIDSLVESGALGLMNVRTQSDRYGKDSYAQIGAGGSVTGGDLIQLGFNGSEQLQYPSGEITKAAAVFDRLTNTSVGEDSLVNLGVTELERNSHSVLNSSQAGLLGDTMAACGLTAAVLGNADTSFQSASVEMLPIKPDESGPPGEGGQRWTPHREATAIAMDRDGTVPTGLVSLKPIEDSGSPARFITDFAGLEAGFERLLPSSDLLVVDMGQTSRLDETVPWCTEEVFDRWRNRSLEQCDVAIGRMASRLDRRKDLLLICAPTPSLRMVGEGEYLTPIVAWGSGVRHGLVSSRSTRRSGLVTSYDLAPTVLEFLGARAPSRMSGSAIVSEQLEGAWGAVASLREAVMKWKVSRKTIILVFIYLTLAALAVALIIGLSSSVRRRKYHEALPALLLALSVVPLAFLLAPVVPALRLRFLVPLALGVALFVGSAAYALGSRLSRRGRVDPEDNRPRAVLWALLGISSATAAAIFLSLVFNSTLLNYSAFGNELTWGNRFYGLSNAYAGAWIGSIVVIASTTLELGSEGGALTWKDLLRTIAIFLFGLLVIGYGGLGVNFGGTLTAAGVFLATFFFLAESRFETDRLVASSLAFTIGAAGFTILIFMVQGPSSHLSNIASRIGGADRAYIFNSISRKLATSFTLLKSSNWRLIIYASVLVAVIMQMRFDLFSEIRRRHSHVWAGLAGLAVGIPLAIITNDSGVEMAGMIACAIMFASLSLAPGIMEEKHRPARRHAG